jgi:K+-sensing histidine kinase KdpD
MDNGKGFDVDNHDPRHRLFSHPSLNRQENELKTVRRMVIKHGGKIWGVSRENMGAVFYFSLN